MKLHSTYKTDTYYTGFTDLPKDAQKTIKTWEPELENSRYTVGEDSAFLRGELTIDNTVYEVEISLGSCDIKNSDLEYSDDENEYIDDEGRVVDSDQYALDFMQQLFEVIELEGTTVYLTKIDEV